MSELILIETSTRLCSVALASGGKIRAYRESAEPHSHASLTSVFVKQVLDETGFKVSDCSAVCVSEGPGSYTGLRVGSSTAKGLCFASGVPLLSVGTLDTLVAQAQEDGLSEGFDLIIPIIDARRMEVYTAVFTPQGERLGEVEPKIIDSGSFADELSRGRVLFIGDAAAKCSEVISSPNARFVQTCPRASAMLRPAMRELEGGHLRDTAYFEPFYLKQFVATVSKKNIF